MEIFKYLFVLLLVATQLYHFCGANFQVPKRVIGIFKFEKCAPAVAASLAVDNFNKQQRKSIDFDFSYESIPISNLTDASSEKLMNAIIITDVSSVCKHLSEILKKLDSFLICQEEPTQSILKLMEYKPQPSQILSGHNPSSLVHCMFKLLMLIYREAADKDSPVSLVFSKDHPYEHVKNELFENLKRSQIPTVNRLELTNQDSENLLSTTSNNDMFDVPIVNAFVDEKDANNLLCHFYHKNYAKNLILIFVGLPRYKRNWHWLYTSNKVNESYNQSLTPCYKREAQAPFNCTRNELRKAAQRHLLLEYFAPGWAASDNESAHITKVKNGLREGIQKANASLQFEEAPLTYDSVWAILKAIDRVIRLNGELTDESMRKAMLNTSFTGISEACYTVNLALAVLPICNNMK